MAGRGRVRWSLLGSAAVVTAGLRLRLLDYVGLRRVVARCADAVAHDQRRLQQQALRRRVGSGDPRQQQSYALLANLFQRLRAQPGDLEGDGSSAAARTASTTATAGRCPD